MVFILQILGLFLFCHSTTLYAENLLLPTNKEDSVIGGIYTEFAKSDETLLDIGRRFDIGYDQIVRANPTINRWVPQEGASVLIPALHVLPDLPREGIILNLAELRLYYFPKQNSATHPIVVTFPVSIGRMNWDTPLGKTQIISKVKDPSWSPTKSLIKEAEEEGNLLPRTIPGGSPDNPLGHFALYLGRKGYLMHGTDERKSFGIGMRVTHGCIRLYPEDIEKLFYMVKIGTQVTIIDSPVKVGWRENQLFLEVHKPLNIDDEPDEIQLSIVIDSIKKKVDESTVLDENTIREVQQLGNGIPRIIGYRVTAELAK